MGWAVALAVAAGLLLAIALTLLLAERRAMRAERAQLLAACESLRAERAREDARADAVRLELAQLAHAAAAERAAREAAESQASADLASGMRDLAGAIRLLVGRQDQQMAALAREIHAAAVMLSNAAAGAPSRRGPPDIQSVDADGRPLPPSSGAARPQGEITMVSGMPEGCR